MSFLIPAPEQLDPRILISINAVGFLIACFVMAMRCNLKKEAGLGSAMSVTLVVLMVGIGCWAMQVAKISLLPLCINLLLAFLLPEIWNLLKDFSYFSSTKVAVTILVLVGLNSWAVAPFWELRSEGSLISAMLMIIFTAAMVEASILLLRLFDWLEKKETKT